MKIFRLGFLGGGNMAFAIIERFLKSENARLQIFVSDPDRLQREKFDRLNCPFIKTVSSNAETVKNSDYIVLAIKPQLVQEALVGLELSGKIIISIMAGVNIQKIASLTKSVKIVRAMPNLNAKIGKSFTAYTPKGLNEAEEAFICVLLSSFGNLIKISEEKMNAVTGIAGSGPAFVFMFIKAFVSAAREYGFEEADALKTAVSVMEGSASLALENGGGLQNLIDSVCSRGGTTIEGVKYLNDNDFENTVKGAIEKAVDRAKELERIS